MRARLVRARLLVRLGDEQRARRLLVRLRESTHQPERVERIDELLSVIGESGGDPPGAAPEPDPGARDGTRGRPAGPGQAVEARLSQRYTRMGGTFSSSTWTSGAPITWRPRSSTRSRNW